MKKLPKLPPYRQCPVCRRRHDPRWTTMYQGADSWPIDHKAMAISRTDKRLRFCSFDPLRTESYEQWNNRNESERRKHEQLMAWFKRYQTDPAAAFAEINLSENRQQKLTKLRALADHPSTPAHEAQAARQAINRLRNRED